ncbi:hypothetical protein C0Q70_07199 [Pomacea canaliculata]|uniref:L-Fucosyltransferase n=1 Tax=Pomacea canaliculata TaxID=400727 RepID=A0A2T7PEE2_POMCA|nr:hypothetical protein C0Q70_07199 [Pomacea canaliculata]
MASPGFLKASFTYFQRLFANCTFVIASENTRWCRENTPPGAQVEYLDVHSPAVDMSVLVSMDHVITTFGSYSWWIGYLNEGITVYMKDFIVPGTHIGNMFTNPDDYIYPGWVPV